MRERPTAFLCRVVLVAKFAGGLESASFQDAACTPVEINALGQWHSTEDV